VFLRFGVHFSGFGLTAFAAYLHVVKEAAENGFAADFGSVSGDGHSFRCCTVGEFLHDCDLVSVRAVQEKCDEKGRGVGFGRAHARHGRGIPRFSQSARKGWGSRHPASLGHFSVLDLSAMPRGGKRVPGPGKRIGRPPKPAPLITEESLLHLIRSPKSIDRLLELRLKRFTMTKAQFQTMLAEQHGRCALCNEPLAHGWVIDHDHLTLRVRGLLHGRCNTLLGFANEDPRRLEAAIAYLKRHNKFLD